jgi:hypothetical protein
MNTSMPLFSVSKSEQVPFIDREWLIIQMVQYSISVTASWESIEEATDNAEKLFNIEKDKLSKIVPLLKIKDSKIIWLWSQLKRMNPTQFDLIRTAFRNEFKD